MRFHVLRGEHLFAGQIFEPPGTASVGACLGPPHEIALAHDSNKLSLLVDDWHGAYSVREKSAGHLLDPRIRANTNDSANHHVSGFHVSYPPLRRHRDIGTSTRLLNGFAGR